jgi:hypothetical protein
LIVRKSKKKIFFCGAAFSFVGVYHEHHNDDAGRCDVNFRIFGVDSKVGL